MQMLCRYVNILPSTIASYQFFVGEPVFSCPAAKVNGRHVCLTAVRTESNCLTAHHPKINFGCPALANHRGMKRFAPNVCPINQKIFGTSIPSSLISVFTFTSSLGRISTLRESQRVFARSQLLMRMSRRPWSYLTPSMLAHRRVILAP